MWVGRAVPPAKGCQCSRLCQGSRGADVQKEREKIQSDLSRISGLLIGY